MYKYGLKNRVQFDITVLIYLFSFLNYAEIVQTSLRCRYLDLEKNNKICF